MSAQILAFASDDAVNRAWNSYAEHGRKLLDDPRLLIDREFREELARRDDRWRKLFLARENAG
jgi:hypothetical protein